MITREFKKELEFANRGQLSVFFIGTGSAFSHSFYQTNLLLVKGDTHLLIDCGTMCPYIFEKEYNTKLSKVENLLITHAHADHIGGVEELAFISKYVKKTKVNIIIPDVFKRKLWNQSLQGGFHYNEDGVLKFEDYFVQLKPQKIYSHPFDVYNIDFGSLNLKIFRTRHVTARFDSLIHSQLSYGVIIDNKVLFTGDTQFNPEQLEWISKNFNLEVIFHDCDVLGVSEAVHASYRQLSTLDASLKKKMYLNHYSDAFKDVDYARDGFAGFAQKGVYYDFD